MKPLTANDRETKSPDIAADSRARLRALFPEVVTEDGVNVDVLERLIGKTVTDADEKYGLNWHGKRKARQLALTPSTGTLRPCREESADWDTTHNLIIEGDNLEVLKLLQKSYSGKVKLIYIDPPYNTGKDFVYPDDFQDNIKNYLELTGQTGEGGGKLSTNTESSGRYHTDWLNMIYPRLKLARNLLQENGVIFVSIDDHEVHNLRAVMNEIFGEENNVTTIAWQRRDTPANDIQGFSTYHEYAICYAKQMDAASVGLVARTQEQIDIYKNPDNDPRGVWTRSALTRPGSSEKDAYAIKNPTGREVFPPKGTSWRVSKQTLQRFVEENRLWWGVTGDGDMPFQKRFLSEVKQGVVPTTWWDYKFAGSMRNAKNEIREIFDDPPFDYPKPSSFIRRIMEISTYAKEDDIILDFFAGSGTTAQAALELNSKDSGNRRFILVQLPESTERQDFPNIAEITKERTRRVAKKIREANPMFAGDLGFRVFKLASSNIKAWEPNREQLAGTLEASVEHLKTDRTESDILFELLLKLGLDLTVPIETRTIARQQVHSIGVGTLLVCLSKAIEAKEVEPLALGIADWHKAQAPAGESTVVFRDSAFIDDVAKTNLTAILQQHGLENVRSI